MPGIRPRVEKNPDETIEDHVAVEVVQEYRLARNSPRFRKMPANVRIGAEMMRHLRCNYQVETGIPEGQMRDGRGDAGVMAIQRQSPCIQVKTGEAPLPASLPGPQREFLPERAIARAKIQDGEVLAPRRSHESGDQSLKRLGETEELVDLSQVPVAVAYFLKAARRSIEIFHLRGPRAEKHAFAYGNHDCDSRETLDTLVATGIANRLDRDHRVLCRVGVEPVGAID